MKSGEADFSRRMFLAGGASVLAGAAGDPGNAARASGRMSFTRHAVARKGEGCLRVAACQILTGPDVGKSTEKVLQSMEKAAADDVDVIAFPEGCLCGYAGGDYWKSARPEDFQQGEARVIEAAERLRMAVVLGTVHWEGRKLFNDLLVIDRGGIVRGRYSKTHLAEAWPAPGQVLPVYEVAGVKSCFIICHDVRYPELVRLPAIAGAQICYFCSHESGLREEYKLSAYQAMPIARATENTIFCVMANAPANPQTLAGSHGNSKIIHPDGNVLVEAGYFEERLVTATIRLADASRAMAQRAVKDETILREWLKSGAKLVQAQEGGFRLDGGGDGVLSGRDQIDVGETILADDGAAGLEEDGAAE
jgi:omega-amidase